MSIKKFWVSGFETKKYSAFKRQNALGLSHLRYMSIYTKVIHKMSKQWSNLTIK